MAGPALRSRPLDESSIALPPARRRRVGWLLLAATLICALGWVSLRGVAPAVEQGSDATVPLPASSAQTSSKAVPDDVAWSEVAGMPLPVSRTDGPRCSTSATAGCFSRTPRGAGLAAAHLVVRTFPFVGPRTFEATIRGQVIGEHRSTLLRLTRQAYADAAEVAGVPNGMPLTVSTGDAVAGYRLLAPTTPVTAPLTDAEVGLLVRQAEDGGAPSFTEFVVVLHWVDGDWRLEAPDWGDWRSAARTISAPDNEFRPYDSDGALR